MTTAYITHSRCVEHDLPEHPEHAGRLRAVWARLEEAGLASRMTRIEAPSAAMADLLAVHLPEYLELLDRISAQPHLVRLDADTYALPVSYEIARLSAGGVIEAASLVARGDAHNALAAVRPPGHHAIGARGMGFCLLSNIALAARHVQQHDGIQRVLIVDYDVHHGNGTQDVFYDDPSVLFISIHQYPIYPGTGALEDTGTGEGKGYTLNIPIPAGHGNHSYAAMFDQVIWDAARRFQPHMILVSAGFDAHWADPLAGTNLSLTGFAHISRELVTMASELCGGKIAFVMEGGYNLDVVGHGWANIARILLGDQDIPDPLGAPKSERTAADLQPILNAVRQIHQL
jgi:acetoin utilization deacetylase AcuC-like enzyme